MFLLMVSISFTCQPGYPNLEVSGLDGVNMDTTHRVSQSLGSPELPPDAATELVKTAVVIPFGPHT